MGKIPEKWDEFMSFLGNRRGVVFYSEKNGYAMSPIKEASCHEDRLIIAVEIGFEDFDYYFMVPAFEGMNTVYGFDKALENHLTIDINTFEIIESKPYTS